MPDELLTTWSGGLHQPFRVLPTERNAPLRAFVNNDGTLSFRQAESITTKDSTTYTINLKPGWTYQNGEPVTAERAEAFR